MKQERVSMPMGSAGIIGFSPDIKISGFDIDPQILVGGVFLIVILVHVATYLINY